MRRTAPRMCQPYSRGVIDQKCSGEKPAQT
jgi:hypothetical protein